MKRALRRSGTNFSAFLFIFLAYASTFIIITEVRKCLLYLPNECTVPGFSIFSFHGASELRKQKNGLVAIEEPPQDSANGLVYHS